MNVKTEIEDRNGIEVLKIEIPLQQPTPSKSSGKTLIVAGTGGPLKTNLQIDGKQVTVSVNAYIPR